MCVLTSACWKSNELVGGPPVTRLITWSRNVREIIRVYVCVCVCSGSNLRQSVGGPTAVKPMAEVNSSSTPRMCGQCDFQN